MKLPLFYAYLAVAEYCCMFVDGWPEYDSCSGRCGQWWSLPCSCHETCVVYNNCCQDMSLRCPDILEKSLVKFDKNLQSLVECSDQGVFMISQCPRLTDVELHEMAAMSDNPRNSPGTVKKAMMIHQLSNYVDKSENLRTFQTMLSSNQKPMESLSEIFMNVPVTDASTGLVYKNFSNFHCHATSLSVPQMWKVSVKVVSPTTPISVEELSHLTGQSKLVHTPPGQMSNVVHCRPDCIGECGEQLEEYNKDLGDKCEHDEFTYVWSQTSSGLSCYNNLECGQCNQNGSSTFHFVRQTLSEKSGNGLSMFMSLTDDGLELSPGDKDTLRLLPWYKMKCSVEEVSAQLEDLEDVSTQCPVLSCQEDYVIRPDGVCRFPARDKFAVADDDLFLTADDIRIFPEFVQCLMKEALNDEIVHVEAEVTSVHDMRLNTKVHFTRIETFAAQKGGLLDTELDARQKFVKLSAIAKSFQRYRRNKQKASTKERTTSLDNGRDDSLPSNMAIHNTSSVTTKVINFESHLRLKNWDRGKVVHNATKTTVCLCRDGGPVAAECPLRCVQDSWYVNETDVISEFVNLPCLANLGASTNHQRNQGDAGPKMNVWLMMLMVTIYTMI